MVKTEKTKQEIPPLLHPPLLEAVFELRWKLQSDAQTGHLRDVAYPMMYGRIYEKLKKEFSLVEDLPSMQVHPEASPFIVRHRMRKERNAWPLVQIGPGIATVNDTRQYSWSTFKSFILRLMGAIIETYPIGEHPLNFIKSELRFINAVSYDSQKDDTLSFLAEKLHIKIEMEKQLFEMNEIHENPNTVGLNLAYALKSPMGHLMLGVNLGQVDTKPAYILQTVVQSVGETVSQEEVSMKSWLKEAHDVLEHCFLSLCKGLLMQRYTGNTL